MAKNTMPSAKAVLRMACTRIFVAAPGLRPTASEAFMPMKPTPRAAPSAANPTCTFPLSCANTGINICAVLSFFVSPAPAIEHGQTGEIRLLVVRLAGFFFMLADQHGKDGGE